MELNGYYFRSLLKKTRRRFALCAGEQALYQELVDICNEENWRTSFQVSNGELTTALACNEKTLAVWRQSLVNAGLIKYVSGKSKRAFGIYGMVVETVVKFTTNHTTNPTTNKGTNPSTNPSDYNKLKETKPNEKSSFSGGGPPVGKKKKSDSPKKPKAEPVEKTKHWQQMVDLWFGFNEKNFFERPSFSGADPRHLKRILEILEKRATAKNIAWTLEVAKERFDAFLEAAFKDSWLSKNFLLTHLEKFIDKIILNHGNNGQQNAAAKQKGGGSIDELQSLKRKSADGAAGENERAGSEDYSHGEEWQEAEVVE